MFKGKLECWCKDLIVEAMVEFRRKNFNFESFLVCFNLD